MASFDFTQFTFSLGLKLEYHVAHFNLAMRWSDDYFALKIKTT
jgi:hypothetical protein